MSYLCFCVCASLDSSLVFMHPLALASLPHYMKTLFSRYQLAPSSSPATLSPCLYRSRPRIVRLWSTVATLRHFAFTLRPHPAFSHTCADALTLASLPPHPPLTRSRQRRPRPPTLYGDTCSYSAPRPRLCPRSPGGALTRTLLHTRLRGSLRPSFSACILALPDRSRTCAVTLLPWPSITASALVLARAHDCAHDFESCQHSVHHDRPFCASLGAGIKQLGVG